jgi:hypothetical protein
MEIEFLNFLPVYNNAKGEWNTNGHQEQSGYIEFKLTDIYVTLHEILTTNSFTTKPRGEYRDILAYCSTTNTYYVLSTNIPKQDITTLCMYYRTKGRYINRKRIKQITVTKIYLR